MADMAGMDAMADELQSILTCTLCGAQADDLPYYNEQEDTTISLCDSCLENVKRSLEEHQLYFMTPWQLKRHMEVRDGLANTYKHAFKATKTFYIGKRRNRPILEVDEEQGLWAIPNVPMPLALSLDTIVDVELALSSDEYDEKDEDTQEMVEELGVKDLLPFIRIILGMLYKSKHTNLAPIPKGHFVSYLYMKLSLDDHESGLNRMGINLLPFLIPFPSHVNAGYDCAYELIEYLKKHAAEIYRKQLMFRKAENLEGNDRLSILSARGQLSAREVGFLLYYRDRLSLTVEAGNYGADYNLVKNVIDTVTENILFDERVPQWTTQHSVGRQTFVGAFSRYAPGLSVGEVVYVVDRTNIQSGKGGILFAQNCFAVDSFTPNSGEYTGLLQPIEYDDLLYVGLSEDSKKLTLVFRDGRRFEVKPGRYGHCLFAIINLIVFLRAS